MSILSGLVAAFFAATPIMTKQQQQQMQKEKEKNRTKKNRIKIRHRFEVYMERSTHCIPFVCSVNQLSVRSYGRLREMSPTNHRGKKIVF